VLDQLGEQLPRGKIVVGVDGSNESDRALRWAGSLTKDLDAEISLYTR
jgi:nucleotide-binding universal stress UspA family protein